MRGSVTRITTWGPVSRSTSVVDRITDVVLVNRERADATGAVVIRSDLLAEGEGVRFCVLRACSDDRVETLASALAERLNRPLHTDTIELSRRKPGIIARLIPAGLWVAIAVVAIVLVPPVFSRSRSLPLLPMLRPQSTDAYQEGTSEYRQRNFKQAEQIYQRGIDRDPSRADLWNMLAYSQAEQGKLDDALGSARQAVSLAPDAGYIIDTLAEMHERRKEYVEAERYYLKALDRMSPFDSCETHTKLARTLVALHKNKKAIPHLDEALRHFNLDWAPLAQDLLRSIDPNHRSAPNVPIVRDRRGPRRGGTGGSPGFGGPRLYRFNRFP